MLTTSRREFYPFKNLVKKDIAVLFVPGKALFIDMLNEYTVLGSAKQHPDGLFYISDSRKVPDVDTNREEQTVRAMVVTEKPSKTSPLETESSDDDHNMEYTSSEVVSEQTCREESTYRNSIVIVESSDSGSSSLFGTSKKISSVRILDDKMDAKSPGLSTRDNTEKSRVWHLRLGNVINVGQIRRKISDGTLPVVKPEHSDCEA